MAPRPLQFDEAALPRVPPKCRRVVPPKSQSQSDLTSERIKSQVYSGSITRSRAKALTYAEVTSQSSVTTFSQGRDQPEEQDEATSPSFYDLRILFGGSVYCHPVRAHYQG